MDRNEVVKTENGNKTELQFRQGKRGKGDKKVTFHFYSFFLLYVDESGEEHRIEYPVGSYMIFHSSKR